MNVDKRHGVIGGIKSQTVEATITRVDGTVEHYGVISRHDFAKPSLPGRFRGAAKGIINGLVGGA